MTTRLLQVGMGGFGRSWASVVVPQVQGAELVGCVDIDPASIAKAKEVVSLPPDRFFTSVDTALQTVDADAVLVTASITGHMPAIMAGLEAGKNVLTEKPFAPTVQEAETAVRVAEQRGLTLMVSQNYRFYPAIPTVRDLVAQGKLGRLDSVYIDFRRHDNSAPVGSHVHYRVPNPMLVDMAIHHFDLMRAIIGREPERIACRAWNPPWSKYEEPPEATAIVEFDGGVTVSYRGSWVSPGEETPWAGLWRMEFEGGEIEWTSRGGGGKEDTMDVVRVRPLGGKPEEVPLPTLPYLDRAGSLNAFLHALETGDEPATSGRRNVPTLALTLASVRASQTGQWETLRSGA